jgi:PmbA protein
VGELTDALGRLVAGAESGEGLEAYGVDETETTVRAYEGEVVELSSARTRGVGVRVLTNNREGYSYTADLTEPALTRALAEARDNAGVTTPEVANVLPCAADLPDSSELYDARFADVATADKVDAALRLEASARTAGGAVKGVEAARYGDSDTEVAIASTAGACGSYRRCDASVVVEVVAESDGDTASAAGLDIARLPSELDVERTAAEGVRRATRIVGGRQPQTASVPVVLDPFATASFLGVLAGALSAEAVQKQRSLFAGKLGESVGAGHLTLTDDGRRSDGPAAAPWDDEGVPTGATTLIEDGALASYLHNTYTATKDGVSSTGNAQRSGFKTAPSVSPTNLFFSPGTDSPEQLLSQAGTAFYCQQVLGVHSGANPISGDFSVGATGLMVRDGELAEPVREATIAGTIPGMLAGLAAVGSDLRFLPFGAGMGGATLLVEGMTLAGS